MDAANRLKTSRLGYGRYRQSEEKTIQRSEIQLLLGLILAKQYAPACDITIRKSNVRPDSGFCKHCVNTL